MRQSEAGGISDAWLFTIPKFVETLTADEVIQIDLEMMTLAPAARRAIIPMDVWATVTGDRPQVMKLAHETVAMQLLSMTVQPGEVHAQHRRLFLTRQAITVSRNDKQILDRQPRMISRLSGLLLIMNKLLHLIHATAPL